MANGAPGCPEENLLVRVATGAANESELALVEAHVDGCTSCRRVLAAAAGAAQIGAARASANPSLAATAAQDGLKKGQQVGKYVIEELLGVGGMGVVYVARDPTLDRRVARKLMRTTDDQTSAARLRR